MDLFLNYPNSRAFVLNSLTSTMAGPKYDGKYLRALLRRQLGNITMSQTLTNVLLTTFDIKRLQPVMFTTIDVRILKYFLDRKI